ncbi:Sugar transport protein 4 [Dendrobium catenatum]|uniref:Sugar transport protein 4 n=1 Tax=Dendrobium catenatum TaxID=906689 RepID=A0A2I0WK05_9ASPA|nr:Sugar transport protein 4 [Dendrobium catenatum]
MNSSHSSHHLVSGGPHRTIFISTFTREFGCKLFMFDEGLTFLVDATLNSLVVNLLMLILDRILLIIGVGFSIQSLPLYLSEMVPSRLCNSAQHGLPDDHHNRHPCYKSH